jgi:threonine dehydratase
VDILRDHRVKFLAVCEAEIEDGIRWLLRERGLVTEASAATTIAAIRRGKGIPQDGHLAAVITGRNITWPLLSEIMQASDNGEPVP